MLFAWAGLGAALGPTSVLALYWKRTTRAGVMAGLLVGAALTFVWELTPALEPLVYELIPAFSAGLVATVLVSLATKPPDGVEGMFEEMDESSVR